MSFELYKKVDEGHIWTIPENLTKVLTCRRNRLLLLPVVDVDLLTFP